MKKMILRIFGVAALVAGMMYNVQVFDSGSSSNISLAALVNMAVAQSENPTAPGDSTRRGEAAYHDGVRYPCAKQSTNYC